MYYWRNRDKNKEDFWVMSKGCYVVDVITPAASAISPIVGIAVSRVFGQPEGYLLSAAIAEIIRPEDRQRRIPPEKLEKCGVTEKDLQAGKSLEKVYQEIKAFRKRQIKQCIEK